MSLNPESDNFSHEVEEMEIEGMKRPLEDFI